MYELLQNYTFEIHYHKHYTLTTLKSLKKSVHNIVRKPIKIFDKQKYSTNQCICRISGFNGIVLHVHAVTCYMN